MPCSHINTLSALAYLRTSIASFPALRKTAPGGQSACAVRRSHAVHSRVHALRGLISSSLPTRSSHTSQTGMRTLVVVESQASRGFQHSHNQHINVSTSGRDGKQEILILNIREFNPLPIVMGVDRIPSGSEARVRRGELLHG